jgi:hypothetical protein
MKEKRTRVRDQIRLYSGDTQIHVNNPDGNGDIVVFSIKNLETFYVKDGKAFIVLKRDSSYEKVELETSQTKEEKEIANLIHDLNEGLFD